MWDNIGADQLCGHRQLICVFVLHVEKSSFLKKNNLIQMLEKFYLCNLFDHKKAGIISFVPRHEKILFCLFLSENLVYMVTAHLISVFVFAV